MPSTALIRRVALTAAGGLAAVTALTLSASPAQAVGWDVNQGNTPSSLVNASGTWGQFYGASLKGMQIGIGACDWTGAYESDLTNVYFECTGVDGTTNGYYQSVSHNSHSIASTACFGATTWVYANSYGDYNYVDKYKYGTLNWALANKENSAGNGNEC